MPESLTKIRFTLAFAFSFLFLFFLWSLIRNWDNQSGVVLVETGTAVSAPISTTDLCTADTFNDGEWLYRPVRSKAANRVPVFENIVGYHCPTHFAHRCYQRKDPQELIRSKNIIDFTWKPNHCRVLRFDPHRLAEHAHKHPILFVGDSITQLQYESLACLLGNYLERPPKRLLTGGNERIKTNELRYQGRELNNDKPVALGYIRSDYLLRVDDFKVLDPFDAEGDQMGRGLNYPWVHALDSFDYIVINTGAHWHTSLKWGPEQSENELLAAFRKAMQSVFHYLQLNIKQHQRVWVRSTPYGHVNCSQYAGSDRAAAPNGLLGEYEWHLFGAFDQVWKELITDLDDPRFSFLNVSLSNIRGDAHSKPDRDCLHTCLPGPVDDWNRLLFHEIQRSAVK